MKIGFLFVGILSLSCCSPSPQASSSAIFQTPNTFPLPEAAVVKKPDLATALPKPEIPIKQKASSDLRMRLPDMLSLPEDSQLRSAPSTEPANQGGVIARPPAE